MSFDLLMMLNSFTVIFASETRCSPMVDYRWFGCTCRLHLQGTQETPVSTKKVTWCPNH